MTDPSASRSWAKAWSLALFTILFIVLWHALAAWLLPITQDEAYYADWARHLAWGYFDHPPGVALLGLGTWLAPDSALAARLGVLVANTLTLLVLARLYWNSGLRDPGDLGLAMVLSAATLPGLAAGIILTPDTPLALAWALALHEAQRALAGQRRRWLGAGLAAGLGLLSKYTMAVIGPVFLWAMLTADPRALRTPWPYVGGLLALLVFAPNLGWNAENDWLTLRFQFGHGFALDSGALVEGAASASTIEHSGPQTAGERIQSLVGFLATQLGFWGLMALPILVLPWMPRSARYAAGADALALPPHPLDPRSRALLMAAVLFPLGFFALVSLVSSVEANWPAMYLLAAPALLAPWMRRLRPWVLGAAGVNLLLVTLYVVHGASAALPLPDGQNRILRETQGFRELAGIAATLDAQVYAERYQDTAMLRFYRPGLGATQWPGLSRPSEYLRGHLAPPAPEGPVQRPLWLVSRRWSEPQMPGLQVETRRTLFDCPGQPLVETSEPPCPKPLHVWNLYRLVPGR